MQVIATIGLDIAKSVFQVHGVEGAGKVIVRRKLKRRELHRSATARDVCPKRRPGALRQDLDVLRYVAFGCPRNCGSPLTDHGLASKCSTCPTLWVDYENSQRTSGEPRILGIARARGARRGNPDHETEQARCGVEP